MESPFQAHAAAQDRACLSVKRTFQLTVNINKLSEMISSSFPGLPNTRWIALRLLDGDERVRQALERGEFQAVETNHINT